MKKAVTYILILVLLAVGTAVVPVLLHNDVAFADTNATISGSGTTVHRGQTFTIDVTISDNEGLTALKLLLKYDSSAMKLVDATQGSALSQMTYWATNKTEWDNFNRGDGIGFLWDGAQPDKSNGVLLTLTFDSFITAEVGNYPVEITYDPENTRSNVGVPATPVVTNGNVNIQKGCYSVQYYNYDDTLLFEQDYNESDVPKYNGATPTRAEDEMYSYEFCGWKGKVSNESGVIKYVADYTLTAQSYVVRFYVDGETYRVAACDYNEEVDVTTRPSKQNYTFVGWFTDEACKQKVHSTLMPAHELSLYGYMKYNIREENIPEMVLSVAEWEGNTITIEAALTVNTGIAAMNLELDYDRTNLTFKGFQRGTAFSGALGFTNGGQIELGDDGYYRETTAGALSAQHFIFNFENSVDNSTECAMVLRMQFEIAAQAPAAVYEVTFKYDQSKDVSYINDAGELWYTVVDIVGAKIAKGEKDHWNEPAEGDPSVTVDVKSPVGLPVQTELVVHDVSSTSPLSPEYLANFLKSNQQIKNSYQISLEQDGVTVKPSNTLEVKIKLKDAVRNGETLALYLVSGDEFVFCQSSVVGDELVFSTDKLGTFAIVGSVPSTSNGDNGGGSLLWLIIVLIAIIVILLILLIIVAVRKKKKQQEY